jgi:hypothetical protein
MLRYHILGIKHTHQRRSLGLKGELQSIILANNVVLIAEEVDPNPNSRVAKQKTIANELAQANSIPWLFPIDMTFEEQKAKGIYDALGEAHKLQLQGNNAYAVRAQGVRENYWLDRIEQECTRLSVHDGTVVVICGRNHLGFLAHKAVNRGVNEVICTEYPRGAGKEAGDLVLIDIE